MSDAVIFSPSKGFVCYWSCGSSDRGELERRLKELGLEKFTPPARTNEAALKVAITEYVADQRRELNRQAKEQSQASGEKVKLDKLVRPHLDRKKDGYAIVQEQRAAEHNEYSADFSAKIEDDGRPDPVVVTQGRADRYKLNELYHKAKGVVGGNAAGQSLVEIVAHLGGTTLREIGGVYWVPNSGRDTWFGVIAAFQGAGEKTKVYMMQTQMDEETTRAVTDAIVSEIAGDVGQITQELASGSLGEQALENRKNRAALLRQRVKEYESILEKSLDHLHQVITVAETAAAAAQAMQDDTGVFNEMYAGSAQ